jgi:hypothetical protein
MAVWELSTAYKKSSIERQFWYKDGKCIIREEGYRWSAFTVESDTIPLTMEELQNEDSCYEVGSIDNEESWEMQEMDDGCWSDTEAGRNCTEEDLEAFETAYEENWYEGVEELGWSHDDTEYILTSPLILKNLDNGVEYSGLVDPTTIVHTIELPVVTVNGVKMEFDDKPEFTDFNETARWPFEFEPGYDPTVTEWFPADTNPAHIGTYECEMSATDAWPFPQTKKLEWTGTTWLDGGNNIKATITQWRGLVNNPEATNGN